MEWMTLGVAAALLIGVPFAFWRWWIAPWRDVERLIESMAESQSPRTFLLGGNLRARRIGLALEALSHREQELRARVREGEFSVETILGAMADGLLVVDDKRRVVMMNPELRRIFGIENHQPGAPLLDTLREAALERLLVETLRTGEPQRIPLRITPPSGDVLELEVSAEPLREKSSHPRGAVVLFRDVTQIRRVEEMRRDFVANVSHELRTPLSIFRGYLETLLHDPQLPPRELLRILEVMEKHSQRLNLLVEDVLSLARLEATDPHLEFASIHLPTFLNGVLRDWETKFSEKQLQPHADLGPDLPLLRADENRLQEVVYNLLDNAVKYSNPGGRITVRAERVEDQIQLSVTDEGPGIAKRDLPRIFERFYRADKARSRELGGTGLGLSIVKHIAQLHGGSVQARSELGRGTTISATFPIHVSTDPGRAEALPVTET